MKKIIIFLVICAILHLIYSVFFVQKTTIYKTLSERSKNYILEKKTGQDSIWSHVNLEQKSKKKEVLSATIESKKIVTSCYSLNIALKVEKKEENTPCNVVLTVKNPRARIVIIHKNTDVQKIDDLPEIQLRRMSQDKYEESTYENNGYTFVTFEKNDFSYEKTAFILIQGNFVAITLILPSNRDMNNTFQDILASFQYLL